MNFKLTKIKTICSIIFGLIVGNLIGWQQIILPEDLVWRFDWGVFSLFFVVSSLLVYSIWSLFEKK